MRTLSKLALLALLALPFGSVFAAGNSSLTVTITVTASATIDIAYTNGAGTDRTWTPTIALGVARDTVADSVDLDITNNTTGVPVDIGARVTTQAGAWSVGAAGTQDKFQISASPNQAGGALTFVPFDNTASVTFVTSLAPAASTSKVAIQLTAPSTVSTIHSGQIVVTLLATLH